MLLQRRQIKLKLLITFINPDVTVDFFNGCAQEKKKL